MSKVEYTYDYPRPMVTTDAAVFCPLNGTLHVLLIQRGKEPFKGKWALPGGFVEMDESLEDAAARELEEETGVSGVALRQYHTFGALERDPRGRVITVAYWGWLDKPCEVHASDDAMDARWHPVDSLPALASDHDIIIQRALAALKESGFHAD